MSGKLDFFFKLTCSLGRRGLVVLSIALIMTSCVPAPEDNLDAKLDRIQERIQQNDFKRAERDLEVLLEKNPSMARARAILASVYLRQVDIEIAQYMELERALFGKIEISQDTFREYQQHLDVLILKKEQGGERDQLVQVKEMLRNLQEAAVKVEELRLRLERIPLIDDEQVGAVRRALLQLSLIDHPTVGQVLFRLSLRLFAFKHFITTLDFKNSFTGRQCAAQVVALPQTLGIISSWLNVITSDAELVFKSKATELKNQRLTVDLGLKLIIQNMNTAKLLELGLCRM